jgi:hypothetical protein
MVSEVIKTTVNHVCLHTVVSRQTDVITCFEVRLKWTEHGFFNQGSIVALLRQMELGRLSSRSVKFFSPFTAIGPLVANGRK